MFRFGDLMVPLIAAPMAGGPSTPALVAAASAVGGLGFLAAGYKSPDALAAEIAAVESLTDAPFGVNLFAPGDESIGSEVEAYRAALVPLAASLGVALPHPWPDDDAFEAKLALLETAAVAVASFTFGLPPGDAVARLHDVGTCVVATVASVEDALVAAGLGVDAIVVQGQAAGGHRAVLQASDEPNLLSSVEMLPKLTHLGLPLIAAGGLSSGSEIAAALRAGAVAAQVGTALLLTPEAGTSAAQRAGLVSPEFTETTVTRAFTGRPARALLNDLARSHPDAPASYPAVHQVTAPLRAAAGRVGDLQHTHLWAGTGWRSARAIPASAVLRGLWEDTLVHLP